MRKPAISTLTLTGTLALAMGSLTMSPATVSAAEMSAVEEGMVIATTRKKGNCMGCHKISGIKEMVADLKKRGIKVPKDTLRAHESHGNVGPALVNMKARYPDKAKLRAEIYDPQVMNPNTIMPPFGKHNILRKDELDKVVEYIHTL